MNEQLKNRPVILMGYPKSGTTLLTSLLDGHPQLLVFPEELKSFSYSEKYIYSDSKLSPLEWAKKLTYDSHIQFEDQLSGKIKGDVRNYSDLDLNLYKKKLSERLSLARTEKEVLLAVIESFYDIDHSDKSDKRAWVQKTARTYLYFPLLHEWFGDNLVCLHMKRDPYDNCASWRKMSSLPIENIIRDWKISNSVADMARKKIKNYHFIQYEDLVLNPEKVMHQVCDWIGISFDKSLLQPTLNGKTWGGNSAHSRSFVSVSASSVGVYKKLLTKEEIQYISQLLSRSVFKNIVAFRFRWAFPKLHRWIVRSRLSIQRFMDTYSNVIRK